MILPLVCFIGIAGEHTFFAGRYVQAIEALTEAVNRRPNLWHNWLYLASAYALSDNQEKASEVLDGFKDHELFNGTKYTLKRVRSHEKANHSKHKVVTDGRKKFHEGLSKTSMDPK